MYKQMWHCGDQPVEGAINPDTGILVFQHWKPTMIRSVSLILISFVLILLDTTLEYVNDLMFLI